MSGRGRRRPHRAAPKQPRRHGPAPPLPPYLERLGVSPRKSLGQHYLADELLLGDIADACRLGPDDTVLEIGAGPGGLTEELARRAGQVVAVDIDEELVALTRARLGPRFPGLQLVAADVLDYTPPELLAECGLAAPYVATGNLPYYITQPVVRRLIEADPPPERVVVLVQREVAVRMVGGPGRESVLSTAIRCFGVAEMLIDVPATAFWPPPRVQSAVVRIERHASPPHGLDVPRQRRLMSLVRAGFSEPRRQLHNTLSQALGLNDETVVAVLTSEGIAPAARPQHLDLAAWVRLYHRIEAEHPRVLDVD